MKKLLISSLLLTLLTTACQQQETPVKPQAETSSEQTTAQTPNASETSHDDHDHNHQGGEHDDHHDHAEHDHDHGHVHHHHDEGKKYGCDNNKTVSFVVHNHEGEIEGHLTVDDIVYDLHPDTNDVNAKNFTTNDGVQEGAGMMIKLEGDGLAVHTWTQEKGEGTALFSCKAS